MTAKLKYITETVPVPDGIIVTITGQEVTVKGKKGELKRTFTYPEVHITHKDNAVIISSKVLRKKNKMYAGTIQSHIRNMIEGVQHGFQYKLKVCSGHFPMNISVTNNVMSVKNYLGEKVPRTTTLPQGATVKVQGQEIVVEAIDLEVAGQAAAKIEQLTRITDKDRRRFQDGIYIIAKGDA